MYLITCCYIQRQCHCPCISSPVVTYRGNVTVRVYHHLLSHIEAMSLSVYIITCCYIQRQCHCPCISSPVVIYRGNVTVGVFHHLLSHIEAMSLSVCCHLLIHMKTMLLHGANFTKSQNIYLLRLHCSAGTVGVFRLVRLFTDC